MLITGPSLRQPVRIQVVHRDSEVSWSDLYRDLRDQKMFTEHEQFGSVQSLYFAAYAFGMSTDKAFFDTHLLAKFKDRYVGIATIHALRNGMLVVGVFVSKAHRRRGIAGQLLAQAFWQRKGGQQLYGVFTANSRILYKNRGIYEVSNMVNFFPGALDEEDENTFYTSVRIAYDDVEKEECHQRIERIHQDAVKQLNGRLRKSLLSKNRHSVPR
jgi:GNAT superfamily N-acetyltransferase